MQEPTERETLKVFTFIPNIIDYARLVLLFSAFYFSLSDYKLFLTMYVLSFGLDVVDGHVARALHQTSRFGAALDMLADKFSTPGLLITLSHLYPGWTTLFTLLLILDVASHYFHFYSTLLRGVVSHKIIDPREHFLLRWFYGNKKFFAWTCIGHESFLVLVYLVYFNVGPALPNLIAPLLVGVKDSVPAILAPLTQNTIGVFQVLAFLCAPSFINKTCVHVVQLLSASKAIAEHDVKMRKKEEEEKKNGKKEQ